MRPRARPARRSAKAALYAVFIAALCGLGVGTAFAAAIPTKDVRHLFDITGGAGGPLALPTDVAVGTDGRVYVVDGGHQRVVAFDRRGRYLFSIGGRGEKAGRFENPVGIGTDRRGRVYVADKDNHRIQVFSGNGKFQYSFPLVLDRTQVRPVDVAVGPRGDILYVSGNNNQKVMALTTGGRLLREWGGEGENVGEFRYPATISIGPKGWIYVVDVLNTRVQVFNDRGKAMAHVGEWGVLPGHLFRPKGVVVDKSGRVYVSDSYMDVIQVFDNATQFLYALGRHGKPRKFAAPAGMAIDGNNRLYVAEMLGNKVSVFALGR